MSAERGMSMDGVHLLRKRQHTRLWYRQMPARDEPSFGGALARPLTAAEEVAWAELLGETVDMPAAPEPTAQPPDESAPAPQGPARRARRFGRPEPSVASATDQTAVPRPQVETEWRVVPEAAPSLLLAATELLDARTPGPVLRPGARYRVAGVQNGVVGLYVTDPDGESGLGFCAAVDLVCIDARFASYKMGRAFDAPPNPFRARIQRLTGGLSQATTTVLGAAASNGSRLS
jgi:hypothetical protein